MHAALSRVATAGLLLVVSCTSTPSGEGSGPAGASNAPILLQEVERRQWRDAYDLVSTLRPRWVQARGTDSFVDPGEVQVYVDGTRLGAVGLLRTLHTQGIQRVEWIAPVEAAARWGTNHAHGVIHVHYGSNPFGGSVSAGGAAERLGTGSGAAGAGS